MLGVRPEHVSRCARGCAFGASEGLRVAQAVPLLPQVEKLEKAVRSADAHLHHAANGNPILPSKLRIARCTLELRPAPRLALPRCLPIATPPGAVWRGVTRCVCRVT